MEVFMSRLQLGILLTGLLAVAGFLATMQPAQSAQGAKVGADPQEVQKVLDKAVGYLKTSQGKYGEFSTKIAGPGITAIAVAALLRNGVSPQEPVVAKGLRYLETQIKDDGGIYSKGLANYTTAVALMALKEANTKGQYDGVIKKAADFIKNIQHIEDDLNQGGFGYNKGDRADLSNSAFSVEALLAAGLSKDDPAVKNALIFISKCQNLPGEKNQEAFAKKTSEDDKGGFTYDPKMSDKNPNRTAAGGLRSLGGMTYSGLKSFLYAGVDKTDPRVVAAVAWVRQHYRLDENPGMGKAGLYYYYHTFAKAMDALGEDLFEDAKGKKHDWRAELFDVLQKQQQPNGSWRNMGERTFAEDNPDLSTAFALLSLSYCKKR
jgi:squalene-hopene/tetraprenyl-beta-curcumene cyclase